MGLKSHSLSQAQSGEGCWELWPRLALEKEGGRRGRKVEVVELDLEQLKGDWDRWGWGRGMACGWKGPRKKKNLNKGRETLY